MKESLVNKIQITGKLLDNWLPIKIQRENIPGAVACLALNGVPIYTRAFGMADLDKNIPIKIDAQFRVASMSKMFTAVAIMQLQEAGKLKLDDKVSSYLHWFVGKNNKNNLANVTIRQLLSHKSGITRDGDTKEWITDLFPQTIKDSISEKSIVFACDKTFKYSNHGFAVLGSVIEEVSGIPYEEYVTKHIINVLGLKNTLPELTDKSPKKLIAGIERLVPGERERNNIKQIKTYAYAPSTGFISDATDLAIFLASLNPSSKKSIISLKSRKEIMKVHGLPSENEAYGLGLALDKISKRQTYGHAGGFAGFSTNAICDLKDNFQVIILTNTTSSPAWTLGNNIMSIVYGLQKYKGTKYIKNEPYSGIYRCRWDDMTVVSLGNDLLRFDSSATNPAKSWTRLKRIRQNIFIDTALAGTDFPGDEFRFSKIKSGKAKEISNDAIIWNRI